MKLTEKVSYLKGLMSGLGMEENTKEGRVLCQMAEILDELAHSVEEMQDEVDQVSELVDVIHEDLGDVEDYLEELALDEETDCCCCDDDEDDDDDDDDYFEFDDDDELYEVTCPACKDTICLNEDMLSEGSMDCPNCGKTLEFDFSSQGEDDDVAQG